MITDINDLIPGKLYTAREYRIVTNLYDREIGWAPPPKKVYDDNITLYYADHTGKDGWFEYNEIYFFPHTDPFMFIKNVRRYQANHLVPIIGGVKIKESSPGILLPMILHKGKTGVLHDHFNGSLFEFNQVSR
jgi:hypothetical protein